MKKENAKRILELLKSGFTEPITTETEIIEDKEIHPESTPTGDQEIDPTSASVAESITTRTEFLEDNLMSPNSAAANRNDKIQGYSIEQVSFEVIAPSQQSREEMSIPGLRIPSLLKIAQGIICRISKF